MNIDRIAFAHPIGGQSLTSIVSDEERRRWCVTYSQPDALYRIRVRSSGDLYAEVHATSVTWRIPAPDPAKK